jgi:hypothetical protein
MPPLEPDRAKAQQLLDSVPVTYVIVDHLDFLDAMRRYTIPLIESHPELWQRVYSVPDRSTHVYRRVEGSGNGR